MAAIHGILPSLTVKKSSFNLSRYASRFIIGKGWSKSEKKVNLVVARAKSKNSTAPSAEWMRQFMRHDRDVGGPVCQVAVLTHRMGIVEEHIENNRKDHRTKIGYYKMKHRRNKMLRYIKKTEPIRYFKLIDALGLEDNYDPAKRHKIKYETSFPRIKGKYNSRIKKAEKKIRFREIQKAQKKERKKARRERRELEFLVEIGLEDAEKLVDYSRLTRKQKRARQERIRAERAAEQPEDTAQITESQVVAETIVEDVISDPGEKVDEDELFGDVSDPFNEDD